jgi:hypothetical protein
MNFKFLNVFILILTFINLHNFEEIEVDEAIDVKVEDCT